MNKYDFYIGILINCFAVMLTGWSLSEYSEDIIFYLMDNTLMALLYCLLFILLCYCVIMKKKLEKK